VISGRIGLFSYSIPAPIATFRYNWFWLQLPSSVEAIFLMGVLELVFLLTA